MTPSPLASCGARHFRAGGVLLLLVLLTLLSRRPTAADGTLDQYLEGDGGCNAFNFPASATSAGGQQQEFVPSHNNVSAFDVCVVSAEASAASVTVVLRQGSGGAAIGGVPAIAPAGAPGGYLHVDFLHPIGVVAGQTYSIEISSAAQVSWYGTAPSNELYSAGSSNSGAVQDFAFRSYFAPGFVPTSTPAPSTPSPVAPSATSVPPTDTPEPSRTPRPTSTPEPTWKPAPGIISSATPEDTLPPTPDGGLPPPATQVSTALLQIAGTATPPSGNAGPALFTRVYLPDVGAGRKAGGLTVSWAVAMWMIAAGVLSISAGCAGSWGLAAGRAGES